MPAAAKMVKEKSEVRAAERPKKLTLLEAVRVAVKSAESLVREGKVSDSVAKDTLQPLIRVGKALIHRREQRAERRAEKARVTIKNKKSR